RPLGHARAVPRRGILPVLQGHPEVEHRLMSTTLKLPRLRGRRAEENREPDVDRGILSLHDRRRRPVRIGQIASHAFLMLGLLAVGLGPLLWLAKSAVSTTQAT